jgi:hypothetical protein
MRSERAGAIVKKARRMKRISGSAARPVADTVNPSPVGRLHRTLRLT